MTRKFDITPHPAILSVLGEIELDPWQCVAELVDNSVDGFLAMLRSGMVIGNPLVKVAFGQDTVVIKDNGPGMSFDSLEMAVKAGWSSQEKFGNLGLYGIGFNIATARLGNLTTIWTTQAGEEQWIGLDIDLPAMARGGSYSLEPKYRMKSDPNSSGTEIGVSRLKPDWKNLFTNPQWLRNNVTDRLSKIYSTMLRDINPQPIKFALYVNDRRLQSWEHCVWPADWDVYRKNEGSVRPVQEFDTVFGKKYLSRLTGELHDSPDGLAEDDVLEVPERIYGWIGIQRYADKKDFGIDIIRNGRKIEVGCKSLFDWEDDLEYPIDDPRARGRIVGEVHLDHGYVYYTKHRFEREHSSWKQLLRVIRNNEPLVNRPHRGFNGPNNSPLGLLFRVFRRNSPLSGSRQTWNDILFIKDNDTIAKDWADKYRKGNIEYRNDEKWRAQLLASDGTQVETTDPESAMDQNSSDDQETDIGLDTGSSLGNGESSETNNDQSPESDSSNNTQPEAVITRQLIPQLSLAISGVGIAGNSYSVEVYAADASNSSVASAWRSKVTERGIFEVEVNLLHPAFNSTSLQVRDAILADVAHYISSEESASVGPREGVSYSDVLIALRSRHASTDSLDPNQLRVEIDDLRKKIITFLSKSILDTEQRDLLADLPPEDVHRIELAHARGATNALIIDYLEMRHIAHLFQLYPSRFFENGCFTRSWTPPRLSQHLLLLKEYQQQLAQDVWVTLLKLGEFTNIMVPPPDSARSYYLLIRACINRVRDYMSGTDGSNA